MVIVKRVSEIVHEKKNRRALHMTQFIHTIGVQIWQKRSEPSHSDILTAATLFVFADNQLQMLFLSYDIQIRIRRFKFVDRKKIMIESEVKKHTYYKTCTARNMCRSVIVYIFVLSTLRCDSIGERFCQFHNIYIYTAVYVRMIWYNQPFKVHNRNQWA